MKRVNRLGSIFVPAFALVGVLVATPASAANITYTLNDAVGAVGSLTGSITTDGTLGALSVANIVSWNINVNGNAASLNLNNGNSGVFGGGNALAATASALTFDFSDPTPSYLLFQQVFSSGANYACAASTPFSSTPCYQGLSAVPQSYGDASAQYTGQGAGTTLSGNLVIGTAGAVPEASSWAMMILGLGMTGAALRRRSRTSALAA